MKTMPIVVGAVPYKEAIQFFKDKNVDEVKAFTGDNLIYSESRDEYYIITYMNEAVILNDKDFVVKGINGYFFAVEPDEFTAVYERVEDL